MIFSFWATHEAEGHTWGIWTPEKSASGLGCHLHYTLEDCKRQEESEEIIQKEEGITSHPTKIGQGLPEIWIEVRMQHSKQENRVFHCSLNHLILPPTFFSVHLHIPVWTPAISPVKKHVLWYLSKSMSFVTCLCYGVTDPCRGYLPQERHHLTGKTRSSGGHQVAKDVFLSHTEQIMLYSSAEMFPDTLACLMLLLWCEGFLIIPGFCGINIPAFTVVLTMSWRTK